MVTVYVGPRRKGFIVHKNIICEASKYFAMAFRGNIRKDHNGSIDLQDETPGAFALFVDYLYRSEVPKGHSQTYIDNLYDLYIFAERICLNELRNMAMDQILDASLKYKQMTTIAQTTKVYRNTSTFSKLREFCTICMACAAVSKPPGNSTPVVSRSELLKLHPMSAEFPEFFMDYFTYLQLFSSPAEQDPRNWNDADEDDRCLYHHHGESEICHRVKYVFKNEEFLKDATS